MSWIQTRRTNGLLDWVVKAKIQSKVGTQPVFFRLCGWKRSLSELIWWEMGKAEELCWAKNGEKEVWKSPLNPDWWDRKSVESFTGLRMVGKRSEGCTGDRLVRGRKKPGVLDKKITLFWDMKKMRISVGQRTAPKVLKDWLEAMKSCKEQGIVCPLNLPRWGDRKSWESSAGLRMLKSKCSTLDPEWETEKSWRAPLGKECRACVIGTIDSAARRWLVGMSGN